MGLQEFYFDWMVDKILPSTNDRMNYASLLHALNSTMFYFSIPMDENRMRDGIELRNRFAYETNYSNDIISIELNINDGCTVLEMMVALALKGDERILYDYETGSKADYIFITMLRSMDLDGMLNENFDHDYFSYRIHSMLNHEYEPDGRGGLFTVHNPRRDMRGVDIWYQMNWYLQELIK